MGVMNGSELLNISENFAHVAYGADKITRCFAKIKKKQVRVKLLFVHIKLSHYICRYVYVFECDK